MSTITDENTIFNTEQFKAYTGQNSSSQGSQDLSGFFTTSSIKYNPAVQIVGIWSPVKLTTGFNTYYKMQGFNTATNKYEVWFSMGSPLLIPPSGHTLSNIEIVLVWIDR